MIDRDAYVLSTLAPDDQVDSDQWFKATKVLMAADRVLRESCNLELRIVNLGSYAIEDCKELIRQRGVSSVLSTVHLQEYIIPKTSNESEKYLIVQMLRELLLTLSPIDNLTIVDGYIFPKSAGRDTDIQSYLKMFEDIFSPVIGSVQEVKFITKPRYNLELFEAVRHLLVRLNPDLRVLCRTTDEFHDRFWIVDQARGLFVGTSLNGIGKSYALVDKIRESDVKELVEILAAMRLLD